MPAGSHKQKHPQYVCVHGHFYQPPRENPWLEAIEFQESAQPFHDWNERISAECYLPNSSARIQDDHGHIQGIINNYARMSYNFGPTLLSWMEANSPLAYRTILNADVESQKRFGGHGSAIAQTYNHIILPLASERDKHTQILWGIADFEYRFGRRPEGMWLAETAADTESLRLLAQHGIKFTVLAPRQARRVRPLSIDPAGTSVNPWINVSNSTVDSKRPYLCKLPGGLRLNLFFYDGPASQAIAFEGILRKGEFLAERLVSDLSRKPEYPQLLHVATDGETYGHHHKFGEMALAYALHYIETNDLAQLTNYGEYLELHPPEWEAQIIDNTSWSCLHGVERWRIDCGCNSGGKPGWSQEWRKPLRESLDWLRDAIEPHFTDQGKQLFKDPWEARNQYINVVLNRNPETTLKFFHECASHVLTTEEQRRALQMMEMQRHLMLMYTSCGWFFDEISGIETVQIIQYAGRAIELAEKALGITLESEFRDRLGQAPSNLVDIGNGAVVYDTHVKTARIDLARVAAHYAVISLFGGTGDKQDIAAYSIERSNLHSYGTTSEKLNLGTAKVRNRLTLEEETFTYAAVHFGDHNVVGGVRLALGKESFQALVKESAAAFERSSLPDLIRIIDRTFPQQTYSLASLFADDRKSILDGILRKRLAQTKETTRMMFETYSSMMNFRSSLNLPQPEILKNMGQFILGTDLRDLVDQGFTDRDKVQSIINTATNWNLPLEAEGLEISINNAASRLAEDLEHKPQDIGVLEQILLLVDIEEHLPFRVNLWQVQNEFYRLLKSHYGDALEKSNAGDPAVLEWVEMFNKVGQALKISLAHEEPALK